MFKLIFAIFQVFFVIFSLKSGIMVHTMLYNFISIAPKSKYVMSLILFASLLKNTYLIIFFIFWGCPIKLVGNKQIKR